MTRDEHRDAAKAAFARDPLPLLTALGVEIDERKSKPPETYWAFNAAETDASIIIGGRVPGLCKAFNEPDSKAFDCFSLVERVRGLKTFPEQVQFVANCYGIEEPEEPRREPKREKAAVVKVTHYEVIEDGRVIATHGREDLADGDKDFWWRPKGLNIDDLPLWCSWHLADRPRGAVVICEGEKDTDALNAAAGPGHAVGTYSSGTRPTEYALSALTGRRVYLWPDNDDPGRKHMAWIAQALQGIADSVYTLDWEDAPPKAGAADWFAAGKTVEDLRRLMKAAREHVPSVAGAVDEIPYEPPARLLRGAVPVADVAAGILERTEARRALPRRIYGMRSGWETLDWHYLGFRTEALILLTGQSGMGKTAVARHFLFASADAIMQAGLPDRLLFYALEGGKDQVLHYWAGWRYGIPARLLQPGSEKYMTDEWADLMTQAYSSFVRLPIDVCDTTKDADAILFDVDRRCQEGPVQGVVLDNIQELDYACGGNMYENQKRTGRRARDIAEQYGITFIALNQVNSGKDGWRERGGPDWGNAATTRFHIERGEKGSSDNERANSNLTILYNIKRRYGGQPCAPLRLRGNWQTGRLYEETEEHQQAAMAATTSRSKAEEVDPWHSN